MTKRSPFVERSWRCCALGCRDFLTLQRLDLDEPPCRSATPDTRAMYLLFHWTNGGTPWRDRLRRAWTVLRHGGDDWYEFSIEEPHTAREMAEWLSSGADALEREGT